MRSDAIMTMPEGRELDALIAEKVMGIDLSKECEGDMYNQDDFHWSCTVCSKIGRWDGEYKHTFEPKHYSTKIADAWEVAEKLGGDKHRQWYLCTNFSSEFGHSIYAEIFERMDESEIIVCSATAETAPLAICRAALLATVGDNE